ncbi:hypothetical protein KEM48_012464 [Puccinia striiformis f. sp. tritici PST-130]|nr:hypothetical protein KEM48_012464 [Puccinia striiformis f. sp. tritici PST-130]
MPGGIPATLAPGEAVFYDPEILHRGTYDPKSKRRTLHGAHLDCRADISRAGGLLQHFKPCGMYYANRSFYARCQSTTLARSGWLIGSSIGLLELPGRVLRNVSKKISDLESHDQLNESTHNTRHSAHLVHQPRLLFLHRCHSPSTTRNGFALDARMCLYLSLMTLLDCPSPYRQYVWH